MSPHSAWVDYVFNLSPKYPVQTLVPSVKLASSAQLAGVFFIEWGDDAARSLPNYDAVDRPMRNGDDAYGFPPYEAIAPSLYQSESGDLRLLERKIVASALQGVPKRLIRRKQGNWWRSILTDLSASPETAAA